MLAGFEGGATVTPGAGVSTPGVSEEGVWVAINNVEVGKARDVGVGGTGVEGDAQPASRANPIKMIDKVLVFIIISSFINYILLIYLQQILSKQFLHLVF